MKNAKLIIVLLIVGAIVAGILLNSGSKVTEEPKVVLTGDPVDATMDFYAAWLDARKIADTNPYDSGAATNKYLSPDFIQKLADGKDSFFNTGVDPVLCQTTVPDSLRTKTVLQTDDQAQVLILARGELAIPIAIAKLGGVDGEWKIIDVDCNAGERGPEIGEYNFEKSGRLLKASVRPPLDANYWHLIYERDGVMGYVAQLTFNENTVCTMPDDTTTSCADETFYETIPVEVKGNMTEAGLEVVLVKITELDPVE